MRRLAVICSLMSFAGGPTNVSADDNRDFFEVRIRPLLIKHCLACHGPKKQESGLRLDSRSGWTQGGDRGTSIVPGKVQDSLLIKAISHSDPSLKMPPAGKLSTTEISALTTWIQRGAYDPRQLATANTSPKRMSLEQARDFWSFQPIASPVVPKVEHTTWVQTPVDAFIRARLQQRGLSPVMEADKRTLIRRATFDLTGLPPTSDDIEAYLKDDTPHALGTVVERLLNSPAYGERWGRHWLDVARYADTAGDGADYPVREAYKYRDWVIGALNGDLPYDRFVIEQLAGDEIADATTETVLATGFHRVGPWDAERGASVQKSEVIAELYNELDDMVSTTSQVFLGLTMGCARCHDHKFDPLTAKDYYSMVAVFRGLKREHNGRAELSRAALPPGQLVGKDLKTQPMGYFFFEPSPTPPVTHLLKRGNPDQLGEQVTAAVPVALVGKQPVFDAADKFTSRRRISLARWIMAV